MKVTIQLFTHSIPLILEKGVNFYVLAVALGATARTSLSFPRLWGGNPGRLFDYASNVLFERANGRLSSVRQSAGFELDSGPTR